MRHYLQANRLVTAERKIKILAWAIIISAILTLGWNILKLTTGMFDFYLLKGYSQVYILIMGIASIITAIAAIVSGYGLYKWKEWGRQATITSLIMAFVIFGIGNWVARQHHQPWVPMLAPTIFFVFLLYSLSRLEVLKQFS